MSILERGSVAPFQKNRYSTASIQIKSDRMCRSLAILPRFPLSPPYGYDIFAVPNLHDDFSWIKRYGCDRLAHLLAEYSLNSCAWASFR